MNNDKALKFPPESLFSVFLWTLEAGMQPAVSLSALNEGGGGEPAQRAKLWICTKAMSFKRKWTEVNLLKLSLPTLFHL